MSARSYHIVRYLLFFINLCAVGYLVWRLVRYDRWSELLATISSASSPWWVIVPLILMPLQVLLEAWRWQTTLHGLVPVTIGSALRQVLSGFAAAFVTPYRMGEMPTRLLAVGYSMEKWRSALGGGQQWLKDWRKWLLVAGQTCLRYVIWGLQLWSILTLVGVYLTPSQAVRSIAVYYFVVSVMPSLPAADVPIKGGWASLVFGIYTDNIPALMIAVTLIWIINTVLPLTAIPVNTVKDATTD